MSRNIPKKKTFSNDVPSPTPSPKHKSETNVTPLLSPRSHSLSPQFGVFLRVTKPPIITLMSEKSFHRFWSKSKKLPSPIALTRSVTKYNLSTPAFMKRNVKTRRYQAAATENGLKDKVSPPKEPCSPTRPPIHVSNKSLNEEEPHAGETFEKQPGETQEVESKGNSSNSLPYKEQKRRRAFRRTANEAATHSDQFQSSGNSRKALPTELLTGSSSPKTAKGKHRVTSKDQRITEEFPKTKTPKERKAQTLLSSSTSDKHKSKSPHFSPKTQPSVQKTDVSETTRKQVIECIQNNNKVTENYFKRGTPRREKMTSPVSDEAGPV
ncbi:muscle M-line assembly protein unc-89-like [Nothobranchius furzeri]|uniref:muscle M-line assembly protein unc-89-like n=1 Tax=Nothobranchius furzeri TaxID=105023 RepID=UPI003904E026